MCSKASLLLTMFFLLLSLPMPAAEQAGSRDHCTLQLDSCSALRGIPR